MGTNNTEALRRIQNHIKKVVGQEVDFGVSKIHIISAIHRSILV